MQDSGSISVAYKISGAPTSLSVSVSGMKNSQECELLDTYSGTTDTTRTITLSDNYTAFRFVAVFAGGQSVSVAASVTATGSGPTFSTTSLPAVQTYNA